MKYHRFVWAIILNKLLAVLFLVTHANIATWPMMIFLAAAGDGFMALLLLYCYRQASSLLPEQPF